ncbi:transposase [Streptomyces sp. NBC_01614]|uniref:transposase n=1 Tax=Streptomyces sp. NBC_01614 TaxID=2975897 RepID=UPI0038648D79
MKFYSPEFKADAVALYLSDAGHALAGVAQNLGVSRDTLPDRVSAERARHGGADSTNTSTMKEPAAVSEPTREEQLEAEAAALRAELKQVRKGNTTLTTERDILRQATKYFAGEMSR